MLADEGNGSPNTTPDGWVVNGGSGLQRQIWSNEKRVNLRAHRANWCRSASPPSSAAHWLWVWRRTSGCLWTRAAWISGLLLLWGSPWSQERHQTSTAQYTEPQTQLSGPSLCATLCRSTSTPSADNRQQRNNWEDSHKLNSFRLWHGWCCKQNPHDSMNRVATIQGLK